MTAFPVSPLVLTNLRAFPFFRLFSLTARTPDNSDVLSTLQRQKKDGLKLRPFFGAGRGIRTPVGFHPNGFQDRLVMTASIFLHLFYCCIFPNGLTLVPRYSVAFAPFKTHLTLTASIFLRLFNLSATALLFALQLVVFTTTQLIIPHSKQKVNAFLPPTPNFAKKIRKTPPAQSADGSSFFLFFFHVLVIQPVHFTAKLGADFFQRKPFVRKRLHVQRLSNHQNPLLYTVIYGIYGQIHA